MVRAFAWHAKGREFESPYLHKHMLKKIFIPGWMDTADNRVDFPGWEIWKNKINSNEKIDAEYIVGHSLGANFALINWDNCKNTKLILVNPLVPKRNIFSWLLRWIKFLFTEGTHLNRKRFVTFLHIINGIKVSLSLLSKDLTDIFDRIPRENIIIIRGKEDKHFFNKKIADALKAKSIKIIEVEKMGHGWNDKFNEVINNLTK